MPMQVSRAKVILLAIELAHDADFTAMRSWFEAHPRSLNLELALRILLTAVPESTDPSHYTPLLQWLNSSSRETEDRDIDLDGDHTSILDLSEDHARQRVRRLRLLPLLRQPSILHQPTDPLSLFLIHRAHQIDAQTGLLTLLPQLIEPFLGHARDLRTWFVSTLLPLLRLKYEYHPDDGMDTSLSRFEKVGDREAVKMLLARTGSDAVGGAQSVGRDLRGLVGPWMYGSHTHKRRQMNDPKNEMSTDEHAWHDVFAWLLQKSNSRFDLVVDAVEQWNGPSDVDLGGYDDGVEVLQEDDRRTLDRQYAQAALAAIYTTPDSALPSFNGAHRILSRIAILSKLDTPPDLDYLEASSSLVDSSTGPLRDADATQLLSHNLLHPNNPFTVPSQPSLLFLHSIILSAIVLARLGHTTSIINTTKLCLVSGAEEQRQELLKVVHHLAGGQRRDGGEWVRIREELRWLRGWGSERKATELASTASAGVEIGVFAKVEESFLERELLKALLHDSHYQLAINIYLAQGPSSTLTPDEVEKIILDSAMSFYDNASNCSRNRGGVKKASDVVRAFYPSQFPKSISLRRATRLLDATEGLSYYSLTLVHRLPFQPVNIRVHPDPVSLLGKVLEQNRRSYSKLDDLLQIGQSLLDAGLLNPKKAGVYVDVAADEQLELALRAERRIMGMAIEAALADDDFETAYSYVLNRLSSLGVKKSSGPDTAPSEAGPQTTASDDIAWRAAFRAGRHRPSRPVRQSGGTAAPASQSEIRTQEMRMELLSQALLLAPPAALSEILGVWRRCEEEMNVLVAQECQEEAQWDDHGDRKIPGQFISTSPATSRREGSRMGAKVEAPMGLFDVARGAAAAISKSAFPLHGAVNVSKSSAGRAGRSQPVSTISAEGSDAGSTAGSEEGRVRKRDMVSSMVTGGLASGIGWVLGASPATTADPE